MLEKIYENALAYQLRLAGLKVERQHPVEVRYDGVVVGTHLADLLVGNRLVVELRAVKTLEGIHGAQFLNDLKASGHWLRLLLNFGNPDCRSGAWRTDGSD